VWFHLLWECGGCVCGLGQACLMLNSFPSTDTFFKTCDELGSSRKNII
jgi:hypothetical protein